MSLFSCVLWKLDHNNIVLLCTAWRQAIRRVWSLPYTTHSSVLPQLCHSLPLLDEIRSHTFSFIRRCLSHRSALIRSTATYGTLFARVMSPVGRSLMFCMYRYDFSLCDFTSVRIDLRHVKRYYNASLAKKYVIAAEFLQELVQSREGTLFSTSNLLLTSSELSGIISYAAMDSF
jgi:hypothetical protein